MSTRARPSSRRGSATSGLAIVGSVAVADPALRSALDLTRGRRSEILDDTGVLGLTPFSEQIAIATPSGPVVVDLRSSIEALGFDRVPQTQEEYDRASLLLGQSRTDRCTTTSS